MYTLNDEVRKIIQDKPFKLLNLKELHNMLGEAKLITVGDVVSKSVLDEGLIPDLMIFDGMTERRKIDDADIPKSHNTFIYYCANKAGEISDELTELVKWTCNAIPLGSKYAIKVDGEEDLAILPVIEFSPQGTYVLYGIPKVGVAYIIVDDAEKSEVTDWLWRMSSVRRG